MNFTCHTTYDQKTMTALARGVRKTVRAKRNRRIHLFAWIIIGIILVITWLSREDVGRTVVNCAVVVLLLLVNWKEDALNAFFARRKLMPGTGCADTAFYPDHFLVKTAASESKWQYDTILALAETRDYLVLVMGENHAMALEKAALEGGTVPEFCRLLEEKSGRKTQNIGG